jgi:hypothetical protein
LPHCADKNAEKHAPTQVIELSSSPDERHPAKRKSGCENFSQKNKKSLKLNTVLQKSKNL